MLELSDLEILDIQKSIDEAEFRLEELGINFTASPYIVRHNANTIIGRSHLNGFFFKTNPGDFKPSIETNSIVTNQFTWIFDRIEESTDLETPEDCILFTLVDNITGQIIKL